MYTIGKDDRTYVLVLSNRVMYRLVGKKQQIKL